MDLSVQEAAELLCRHLRKLCHERRRIWIVEVARRFGVQLYRHADRKLVRRRALRKCLARQRVAAQEGHGSASPGLSPCRDVAAAAAAFIAAAVPERGRAVLWHPFSPVPPLLPFPHELDGLDSLELVQLRFRAAGIDRGLRCKKQLQPPLGSCALPEGLQHDGVLSRRHQRDNTLSIRAG